MLKKVQVEKKKFQNYCIPKEHKRQTFYLKNKNIFISVTKEFFERNIKNKIFHISQFLKLILNLNQQERKWCFPRKRRKGPLVLNYNWVNLANVLNKRIVVSRRREEHRPKGSSLPVWDNQDTRQNRVSNLSDSRDDF